MVTSLRAGRFAAAVKIFLIATVVCVCVGGADCLPPSNGKDNMWSYLYTFPYVLIAWCLIKHQGQLCIAFTH